MQVISGYSAVTLYSTSIFHDKNDESASLKATVYIGAANTLAVMIFTLIVDGIISDLKYSNRTKKDLTYGKLYYLYNKHTYSYDTSYTCYQNSWLLSGYLHLVLFNQSGSSPLGTCRRNLARKRC